MSDLLTTAFLSALISGAILAGMPLVMGALGETVSERAGVLNIGLEGMMLVGGYAGFVAALYSGSHWLGLLTGAMAGMALSLVMVVFCVRLGLDQIVVGIAILITAEGLTSVLHTAQFGTTYPRLDATPTVAIPLLSRIPVVGTSLFTQPLVVYLALGMAVLLWWVLRSTNVGLNLRAAGEKPAALDAAGVSVAATRSGAVLFTGAMAGLGGAYLSIIAAGIFVPFMTHGAGFISIVIAMLARGKAAWVVIGAFLFGASVSLTTALQLVGISVPIDLVNMLPFVVVMIALVIFARQAYLPASLAIPYVRGAR
jgi:ABC-type uncharacterized transport system permease subunit